MDEETKQLLVEIKHDLTLIKSLLLLVLPDEVIPGEAADLLKFTGRHYLANPESYYARLAAVVADQVALRFKTKRRHGASPRPEA